MIEPEPEFEFIENYTVEIKAIESTMEDTSFWKFIIQIKVLDSDYNDDEVITANFIKAIDIPSYRVYDDMLDAIQDAYGVIELLGFQFQDNKPQQIEILRYNPEEEEYVSDIILYDGFDFYPPETQEEETKND